MKWVETLNQDILLYLPTKNGLIRKNKFNQAKYCVKIMQKLLSKYSVEHYEIWCMENN